VNALKQELGDDMLLPENEQWCRTCDNGKEQTDFLMALHRLTNNKCCHLTDVIKRLHPDAQGLINCMSPDDSMSKEERQACYEDINQWLYDNRSWAYPTSGTSPCTVHGQ